MAFEGGVAGEGAVALTADVAAHARVDLHVLLERTLRLETLPTQQTEDSHVCACGRQEQGEPQEGGTHSLSLPLQAGARVGMSASAPSAHAQGQAQRRPRMCNVGRAPTVTQQWTKINARPVLKEPKV